MTFRIGSVEIRLMMTNMLALPLAISWSDEMPWDDEPGTEFAVFIGPIIVSFSWGLA